MVAPTTTARPVRAVPVAAVVATLCLCGTVVALQQTLVVPLLPDFPEILGTSTDNASWLVTSTLLVGAVATPIVSRLADMIGKRRMMVLCLLVTVTGSVVAALGPSFALVVTGRALQGFGAALIPVGISILRDELPREKVPSAVALMSATLGIGGGIGLPMSGLIYEHLGWHAIFWSSAAIGVVLIVAVLAIVPESAIRTRGMFDYVGAVLLSIALTSLLLAISKGGTWGWTSEPTLGLFLVALVVLVVWVPFELRVSQPLVDIRTSTRRPVLLTNIASVLVGFAMFGNLLATTQQLQLPVSTGFGFGLTVVVAGLYMLPSSLAMVVFAPVSAGITRRSGAKTTLVIGCVLLACRLRDPRVPHRRGLAGRPRGDHRLDRNRHRLRRHAHSDHACGADHGDRLGQRPEHVATRHRHVDRERRGGSGAQFGDHRGRRGRPAVARGLQGHLLDRRRSLDRCSGGRARVAVLATGSRRGAGRGG